MEPRVTEERFNLAKQFGGPAKFANLMRARAFHTRVRETIGTSQIHFIHYESISMREYLYALSAG